MVKASMSNTKYIIFGSFEVKGYVEKPDIIGSFFGQTEGLIGDELEFNNLQKTGKLGRIDIDLKKKNGVSSGKFSIPTAVGKVEVSLLAAAIESVEKIGHCSCKVKILDIKDDREDKRKLILKRAEELLSKLKEELPESSKIGEGVLDNIKKKNIKAYDKGDIFGGPDVLNSSEIILVEGRADVLNLLGAGILNCVCFNGSGVSDFIVNLCKGKIVTAFLDDDYAGKHLLEELKDRVDLNYFCFAPDSKEVEDLNIKEINKALKNREEIKGFKKVKEVENKKIDVRENTVSDKKRDYFIKKEYEKILDIVKSIMGKKEFVILDSKVNEVFMGDISSFKDLSYKGRFLVFDGTCEGTVSRKARSLGIDVIISKSKSSSKFEGIEVIEFDKFFE